jgi:hypothetical protein
MPPARAVVVTNRRGRAVLEQTRAIRFSGETSQRIPSPTSSRTCPSRGSGSINCACNATSAARYAASRRSRDCAVWSTWSETARKCANDPATLAATIILLATSWKAKESNPDSNLRFGQSQNQRADQLAGIHFFPIIIRSVVFLAAPLGLGMCRCSTRVKPQPRR